MKKSHFKYHPNTFTMLGVDGDWAFQPVACKEEFFHAIARNLVWKTKKRLFGVNGPNSTSRIDRDEPTVIYYGSVDRERLTQQADRIRQVLTLLTQRMKLKNAKVKVLQGNAISIKHPKFFLKSPVGMSGLMTFVRHAANTRYDIKNLNDFVNKAVGAEKRLDSWGYIEHVDNGVGDGEHFAYAKDRGTYLKFLNKSLPCFKHKGLDAYRHASDEVDYGDDFVLDGFADYDPKEVRYKRYTRKDFAEHPSNGGGGW
jgi:hypothetical protein